MSSASSNEGTDEDLYKGLTQASSSGYLHTPSKILMLDSNTASALDRTCVSDRNAMYVLSAAAKSMGHSLGEVTLSRSTIRRARMSNRQKTSLAIKEGFKNDCCQHLVIHWDGKICPAIKGAAKREDRIAIVVTGNHTEKLLAVPKVAQGTGSLVADTVKQSVDDWDLGEKIVGMSFDTTASNTGRFNGSCVLLEEKLDRQLLWLPCRHHVHEIICGDVFRSLFGHSQAPTISIFKRFQESWSKINKDAYEACTDTRLDSSLNSLKIKSVAFAKDILSRDEYGTLTTRDDYKELLEMCLVFLGEKSPDISFKQPGAFHHARWMAKVIYVLKIYCFRSQFLMTKREEACCLEFGLFAALLYSESWFRCPLIADAPANDLSLFQILKGYHTTNPIVSKAGIAALKRHLWYLGEELIPLALFAENNVVSCSTKAKIVEAVISKYKFTKICSIY